MAGNRHPRRAVATQYSGTPRKQSNKCTTTLKQLGVNKNKMNSKLNSVCTDWFGSHNRSVFFHSFSPVFHSTSEAKERSRIPENAYTQGDQRWNEPRGRTQNASSPAADSWYPHRKIGKGRKKTGEEAWSSYVSESEGSSAMLSSRGRHTTVGNSPTLRVVSGQTRFIW